MTPEFEDNCTRTLCQGRNFSQANDSLAVSEETEMSLEEIFKLTFEVLIAFIGVIGNILVITVISKLGKKKQPAEFYLQNLAFADLGTLLLTFPLAAIREKAPLNWPFGEFGCRFLYPVPEIFCGASVWFITVIAIERYGKVVKLEISGQNKTINSQRAKRVAVGVWMMPFLIFCLPLYFVVEYYDNPNGVKWCGPVWPSWDREFLLARLYILILTFVSYVVPLGVISFAYLMIFRTIRRSSVFIKAMKREKSETVGDNEWRVKSIRLKENERASKILTPLVLVFAITMLPLNILRLIIAFWPAIATKGYYKNLLYAATVFVIINSSANPVIYSVVSINFRRGVNYLCIRRSRLGSSFHLFEITTKRRSRSRSWNPVLLLSRACSRSRPRRHSRPCIRDTGHQLSLPLGSTASTVCPHA